MQDKHTGEIVRRRSIRSTLKMPSFDIKEGGRYIIMNQHLTGPLGKLRRVLPHRRHNRGVMPGMNNADLNSKVGNIDAQWTFPAAKPTELERKEMIGRCAEIAVRAIFKNFCYSFGGKLYRQRSGGPIGLRITMACSRLVMQEWGERYESILIKADLQISLLKSYVDDIRQACTLLKMGMRFTKETMSFTWSKDWKEEVHQLQIEGESKDTRMARVCLPATDAINPDLKFTVATQEEHPDNQMPTLDFKSWLLQNGHIHHTYYEKPMKNQILLMKRSAMATRQKYTILANELTRRLSNCHMAGTDDSEKERVMEEFTRQIKNSGFSRAEAREIVVSGLKVWKNKQARRAVEGNGFYRSEGSTLGQRFKKKLTGKSSWYKEKAKRKLEDIEEEEEITSKTARNNSNEKLPAGWKNYQQAGKMSRVKSVMFIPYTWDGMLAKRLRNTEETMEPLTNWKIKFVERAGTKVEEMLHKSNPWQG